MELYRIFPLRLGAQPDQSGGALHIPAQGPGRLDNPDRYSVLYLSDAAAGAVAETFGRLEQWTPSMLEGPLARAGSRQALARFQIQDPAVCDLDHARGLLRWDLRPSQVVTRELNVTQAWARRIFAAGAYTGVRWWSYYDPRWGSWALWQRERLALAEVEPLTLAHPAVVEASRVIRRRIAAG